MQEKDEEIKQLKQSCENDVNQIRQEMKIKFQELLLNIDLEKIGKEWFVLSWKGSEINSIN